jgi:hypothetical protein
MKSIIIFMELDFSLECGGLVVQYVLANKLINLDINVKLISPNNIKNEICNEYCNNPSTLDLNNSVVIYGESIAGNPLKAPYVIRWILGPLNIHTSTPIYKTWGPNDLVYYFNYEKEIYDNFKLKPDVYKSLSVNYIKPNIINYNNKNRGGYCYTTRKINFHKNNIGFLHPPNSFEIKREHNQSDYIDIFNKYEYFICYDPLTYLIIISALCGCISIVYQLKNVNKKEWYKTLWISKYLEDTNEELYGVAYGNSKEELNFAKETIGKVKEQCDRIVKYLDLTITNFIADINNFEKNNNTIKNIFM